MSTIEFFKRKPGYCGAKVLIPPLKALEKTQTESGWGGCLDRGQYTDLSARGSRCCAGGRPVVAPEQKEAPEDRRALLAGEGA
jgi:hypothetical protein